MITHPHAHIYANANSCSPTILRTAAPPYPRRTAVRTKIKKSRGSRTFRLRTPSPTFAHTRRGYYSAPSYMIGLYFRYPAGAPSFPLPSDGRRRTIVDPSIASSWFKSKLSGSPLAKKWAPYIRFLPKTAMYTPCSSSARLSKASFKASSAHFCRSLAP